MTLENSANGDKKQRISLGLILSRDQLRNNPIFLKEVISDVLDTPFYLLIFISREDVVKISCFPTKTKNIKKILIRLKEFSPDLVKGISNILKDLNMSKDILHTTGLCYEMENCFYETYLVGDKFTSDKKAIEAIKQKFMTVAKVIDVVVEEIPSLKK